jgi:hypothetical protein
MKNAHERVMLDENWNAAIPLSIFTSSRSLSNFTRVG